MNNLENPYAPPVANPVARVDRLKAPPLTLRQVLLSYGGRIPRRVFWSCSIAVMVVDVLSDKLYLNLVPAGSSDHIAGFIALQVSFFWITLALHSKRWHDRNRSAWWNLIYLPLVLPSLGLLGYLGERTNDIGINGLKGMALYAWMITAIATAVWAFVQCGCTRGTVGPNRYGEDPA